VVENVGLEGISDVSWWSPVRLRPDHALHHDSGEGGRPGFSVTACDLCKGTRSVGCHVHCFELAWMDRPKKSRGYGARHSFVSL